MKSSNNATDLIKKAKTLKKQENFEEALEILDQLYEKFPNSEEIKNILIETLFDYGGYLNDYYTQKYQKALKIFKRITDLSSNNYRAHYNLGIAYYNLGEMENAKNSLETALKIKPDYKYCFYNLGLIYEAIENYEEALKNYEHALEIDPNFTYALVAQSQIRQKLNELKRMRIK
ncbi:MAG: tetratricopeptide repeat protein [Promethearchaeota archaeon]